MEIKKINSFQVLPDELTVIERIEADTHMNEKGRWVVDRYEYFMPIEERGIPFCLACVRTKEDRYYDEDEDVICLYDLSCLASDVAFSDETIVIKKEYLYRKLAEAGITPEQDSDGNEAKQKILGMCYDGANRC